VLSFGHLRELIYSPSFSIEHAVVIGAYVGHGYLLNGLDKPHSTVPSGRKQSLLLGPHPNVEIETLGYYRDVSPGQKYEEPPVAVRSASSSKSKTPSHQSAPARGGF